mgnify:FL=1
MKTSNSIWGQITKIRLAFILVGLCLGLSCGVSGEKHTETAVPESNSNNQISTSETNLVTDTNRLSVQNTYRGSTGLPLIADIVDTAKLGVASISTKSLVKGYFYNFEDQGNGSGFVVRPDHGGIGRHL